MSTMASRTRGNLRIGSDLKPTMLDVGIGLVFMALATCNGGNRISMRFRRSRMEFVHRDRLVTIRAVHPLVDGLGQQLLKGSRLYHLGGVLVTIRTRSRYYVLRTGRLHEDQSRNHDDLGGQGFSDRVCSFHGTLLFDRPARARAPLKVPTRWSMSERGSGWLRCCAAGRLP